jgi:hypothetical protein
MLASGLSCLGVAFYLMFYSLRLVLLRRWGYCASFQFLNTAMYATPFLSFLIINLAGLLLYKPLHWVHIITLLISLVPVIVYIMSYWVAFSRNPGQVTMLWLSLSKGEIWVLVIGVLLLLLGSVLGVFGIRRQTTA